MIDTADPIFPPGKALFWAYCYGTPDSPEGPVRRDVVLAMEERRPSSSVASGACWEVVFSVVPHFRILGGDPVSSIPGVGPGEFAYMSWGDYCKLMKRLQGYPRGITGCHIKLQLFSSAVNKLSYVHEPKG